MLAREPANAVVLNNLATLLQRVGRAEEAAAAIRRCVALVPGVPEVLLNFGDCLRLLGRQNAAAAVYGRALALRPGFPEALNNRGLVLRALERREAAAASFAAALQARPDYAEALNNLGNAVHAQRRIGEAAMNYRKALAVRPDLAAAWANAGNIHLDLANAPVASRSYRRSLAIAPDAAVHTNLIFAMLSDPAAGPAAELAEARRWASRHVPGHPPLRRQPASPDDPERRLTIGYLSADLRRHAVAGNLIEIVDRHDRDRFQLTFYAEVRKPDDVTEHFRTRADGWLSTVGLADEAVAAAIRADKVDILVVLAAHTAANRPAIAALRPAPIAVSLYAPCTTGMDAVDYWLSDAVLTPPDHDGGFVETVYRLPALYTFQTPPALPAPIRDGTIVFGSFNNPGKLTDQVFAAWRRILEQVPAARLRLGYLRQFDDDAVRRRVREAMAGVSDRIEFLPEAADEAAHLSRLGNVDVILDSFPYGGANSTFEPLWMGTPVVTVAGDRFVGRVGAAILGQIGLADLVAADVDAYVATAVRLAGDPPRRAALRSELRDRLRRSRFLDYPAQTRALEDAYRAMWRRWCGR
jgi:protein O-GlcNAc transferase